MLTNPNTCGLFEREIVAIAEAVHAAGAYFYCDGANFNAIVGKVRPGDLGVDAMHINLHKTFSTPHGGGGPGAGPVVLSAAPGAFRAAAFRRARRRRACASSRHALRERRKPFGRMNGFPRPDGHVRARARLHAVATARDGLRQASEDAVLNANYIRACLADVMSRAVRRPPLHARGAVRRRASSRAPASPRSISPRR